MPIRLPFTPHPAGWLRPHRPSAARQLPAAGLWAVLLLLAALPPLVSRAAGADRPEPLIAPDEMLSIDQVRPGMKGYGRSVFQGTRIERFNVTVLGVLRKIDFGGDMILIRIDDGPPVASGAGVSAGMSGSPIYVDGKIIGALAFAWPFARDPVAGVTPIAQMLENYRPGSAPSPPASTAAGDLRPEGGPLQLDGRHFARATVVPDRGLIPAGGGGTLYLAPVATPLMVSGMGRPGLEYLRKRLGRYGPLVMPGPGKAELPPGERPRLEPGAAVGVQVLGGDVDATAIGTVTWVKGEHVVAFGHPFFGLGSIDMPMTTAFIHGIISSQEVSFKMGAPVEAVGAVTQDRNWSIGGHTGAVPRTVRAEFSIRDRDRNVARDYTVDAAVHRDLTPSLLYGSLMNAVGSVSPPSSGTTRGVVEVWPKGLPPVRRENVFATGERRSPLEELFGDPMAGLPLVELLQIMTVLEKNPFGPVPVERVRVSVEISEKRRTAAIERAYADRKRVKPGDHVKIGVVLRPVDGPRETREFDLEVPRNIPGGKLVVGVAGGGSAERVRQSLQITRPQAKSVQQLLGQIADREQNNQLCLETAQPVVGISVSGREFPNLPNLVVEVLTGANPSGIRMVRSHTRQAHATPYVLSGAQLITLEVEADEKDKTGAAPGGLGGGLGGGFGSLLDLFRLGGSPDLAADPGDDGLDDEDATEQARLERALRLLAGPGKSLPQEPAMPSFEELQRLLEGSDEAAGASEGGDETPQRSGVARGPGVWRMRAARDFQKGRLEGILVSSRGEVGLAPAAHRLLTSPDRSFWAQTADAAGNVYVGGWLEGSVIRIDPSGAQKVVLDRPEEVAIVSLAASADGAVYAAAEPSGTIYRVAPDGSAAPFARIPDERVWALRSVGDVLYAGTGSEGRLYRIGPGAKVELVFTAPDRHVFALADDGKGTLYLGTYPRGKVFRHRDGKTEPLHELPTAAVTALACDAAGNVYAGTSPKATIVKITPAGETSTVFQSTEKHVFSLVPDAAGNLYAGVGRPARLYRVAPDRTVSTLWNPEAAYLLALSRTARGDVFATTAGPTQVVRLGAQPAPSGVFTSAVLNAGNVARWGMLRWSGAPAGVEVSTRTGNTAWPDATWSEWSRPHTRPAGEPVVSPLAQYLQYRILLKAPQGAAPPSLRNLEIFYRPRNRAPELALQGPAGGEVLSGTRAVRWTARDPDRDRLRYEVFYAPEGSDRWVKIGERTDGDDEAPVEAGDGPAAQARRPESGLLARRPPAVLRAGTLRARAAAPRPASRPGLPAARPRRLQAGGLNTGGVVVGAGENSAVPAAEEDAGEGSDETLPTEPLTLTWNTRGLKDGRYRLRVTVTDSPTSPDEPAAAEALSELVLVDNTPPRVALPAGWKAGLAPPAELAVRDAGTYVASAEYRVDGGEWIGAAAADGIFDSPEESLRLDPVRLPAGRHALEVRVRDAAGSEAVIRLVYVKPRPALGR